jgi:glycosyltransferase involved in cell wall biosynthesis
MPLKILDTAEDEFSLGPSEDGTYEEANGGTEMMKNQLYSRVDPDLLDQFQIICSRVRWVDSKKPTILWCHDTWDDPESQHLKEEERRKQFEKFIFVSNYQLSTYNMALQVPYAQSFVMQNAIDPIELKDKNKDQIKLIYHTTPHRGLNVAVAAIMELAKKHGDKIHFDVFSSFEAYGWKDRDKEFEDLFNNIKEHPQMTYHGYQPNEKVREALQESHIFAYPSIWPETSCIAAIEAMSAGCQIVCPNYAALPETTANFATMYQWSEDIQFHANVFANMLNAAIQNHYDEHTQRKLLYQKNYTDNFYNWDLRANQWTGLLQGLINQKTS